MDLSRLRTGERIAGISGLALLLIIFIPDWFTVSAETGGLGLGISVGGSAWETMEWIRWFLLLASVFGIALGVLALRDTEVNLPVATSALACSFGILAVLFIVYRIIDPIGGGDLEEFGVEIGRGIGIFLGLVAAAGITYGGWIAMQEEGTSFGDQADRFRGSGSDAPPPPPPPAPPAA